MGRKDKAFKDDPFTTIPTEAFADLAEGNMTPSMWCAYTMMISQADWHTGIWTGTAYRLQHGWGFQIPERTMQDAMHDLHEKGYTKSFHVRGKKIDYPVAIHGFRVRSGPRTGFLLDAHATTDPRNPVFVLPPPSEEKRSKNPDNGQPTPQPQRSDSAATVRDECDDSAVTVRRECGDSAASLFPNARNTLDILDSSGADARESARADGVEDKNRSAQNAPVHTNQMREREKRDGTDGWLSERLSSIYRKKANTVCKPSAEESQKLNELADRRGTYGDVDVLLAFYHFAERDRGLDGIAWPFTVFLKEAEQWIEQAYEELRNSNPPDNVMSLLRDMADTGEEGYRLLSELAYREGELRESDEYEFSVVHDYLNRHPELELNEAA